MKRYIALFGKTLQGEIYWFIYDRIARKHIGEKSENEQEVRKAVVRMNEAKAPRINSAQWS